MTSKYSSYPSDWERVASLFLTRPSEFNAAGYATQIDPAWLISGMDSYQQRQRPCYGFSTHALGRGPYTAISARLRWMMA